MVLVARVTVRVAVVLVGGALDAGSLDVVFGLRVVLVGCVLFLVDRFAVSLTDEDELVPAEGVFTEGDVEAVVPGLAALLELAFPWIGGVGGDNIFRHSPRGSIAMVCVIRSLRRCRNTGSVRILVRMSAMLFLDGTNTKRT